MIKQRQKIRQNEVSYKKMDKESDSEDETELRLLKPSRREIPSIEKEIEEGDTLQSIAIRYHCTIEELKRLNNIHNDNEIFAKKTMKVPQRPFSMALAAVHTSGNSSPKFEVPTTNLIDIDNLSNKLTAAKESEVNDIIFNSSITQIVERVEPLEITEEEEEVRLIPQQLVVQNEAIASRLSCSGVDADLNWVALLICVIVVCIAVPLIYVTYIYEHPEQFHHDHIS